MPLETYEQVRPWATAIKKAVLGRTMPPWFAVKGFGAFRNDLSASQEDIAVISSWVEGGAPKGDSAFLPPPHEHEDQPDAAGTEFGASIPIERDMTLTRDSSVAAIRPENVPQGGSLQALARRPDGSVVHLLWVQGFDPRWRRDYEFRDPVRLPRGTRLILRPAGVSATLLKVATAE